MLHRLFPKSPASVFTDQVLQKELYKRRNEVERLFCRVKRFRRIATRYDKLDVIFLGFLLFAFVVDFLILR